MKVTVIADPGLPVPPPRYGGTERIVAALCDGLLARGHDLTLLAGPGSRTEGRLIEHRRPGRTLVSRAFRKLVFQPTSVLASRSADVVHNFGRIDYTEALIRSKARLVYTFENPVADWERDWLSRRAREGIALVGISDAHCRDAGPGFIWRRVYNCVDTDAIRPPPGASTRNYLAFLGRLTSNKGVDIAIAVAKASGIPLRIAGNISAEPSGPEFFETQVRPHLGGSIEWIGEISDADKSEFLGNALAVLFPIRWPEPFGIVLAEALATGTPVIAMRRGSAPEIVSDGETGFVVDDEQAMIEAVSRVRSIDGERCRTEAVRRFSVGAMVEAYLGIYASLGAE